MSMIKLKNVSKFYYNKNTIASGFNKINLELDMGEFVVITGESGSGKSTLLNVISGLDSYEEGEMYINGEETSHYSETDYEIYRRKYIGNIFQHFNLINSYTVYQNIELILLFNGYKRKEIKKRILDIINTVGLSKYKNTKTSKLSGGQKQRVAIARALASETPIIVADEPTGNLDVKSAKSIMKLLHDISKDKLVVIVTHNYEQVEEYTTRKITMSDGKIIEDKKIVKTPEVKVHEKDYKDITNGNKLMLGIRNAFNIKTKFLLLLFVYLFLTASVFSQYSSIKKMEFDQKDAGYNDYFNNDYKNRIIVNKKDRSSISDKEIEEINKIDNVDYVFLNDAILDMSFNLEENVKNMYFNGTIASTNAIDSVDMGTIPSKDNEIALLLDKYDFYLETYKDEIIGTKINLYNQNEPERKIECTITGIKYADSGFVSAANTNIYVSNNIIDELKKSVVTNYSSYTFEINNKEFKNDEGINYFVIKPNKKVSEGYAYIHDNYNRYCNDYSCVNANIKLGISNIYSKNTINLKVKEVINSDNIKKLTGIDKENMNALSTIYINEKDYESFVESDTYQLSVFIKDIKNSDMVISTLKDKGYNTIYVRDTLKSTFGEIGGIIKIFRSISFIVSAVVLFFISYFIIRIILKSRNVYYSTIRILGATKKQASSLLKIELLVDINLAYLIFILLILTINSGLIHSDYMNDVITYFKLTDYILVYLILIIMSLLISNRYASKLFKNSAMSTYREEV